MPKTKVFPGIKRILSFFFIAIMAFTLPGMKIAAASDLGSSYDLFKNDPTSKTFIERMLAGGATEAELENFLKSLDTVLSESGELTEANFNSKMFAAIQEVLLWRSNTNVCNVLTTQFESEIKDILTKGILDPSLLPLRNAVKDYVLYGNSPSAGNTPGGNVIGGGGGGTTQANSNPSDALLKEISSKLLRMPLV